MVDWKRVVKTAIVFSLFMFLILAWITASVKNPHFLFAPAIILLVIVIIKGIWYLLED